MKGEWMLRSGKYESFIGPLFYKQKEADCRQVKVAETGTDGGVKTQARTHCGFTQKGGG